jgi:hypothetical protein
MDRGEPELRKIVLLNCRILPHLNDIELTQRRKEKERILEVEFAYFILLFE